MGKDVRPDGDGYTGGPISQMTLTYQSERCLPARVEHKGPPPLPPNRLTNRGLCLPWLWPLLPWSGFKKTFSLPHCCVPACQFFVAAGQGPKRKHSTCNSHLLTVQVLHCLCPGEGCCWPHLGMGDPARAQVLHHICNHIPTTKFYHWKDI